MVCNSKTFSRARIVEGVERYVRSCPCLKAFANACQEVSPSFAAIARITACTGKLVDNIQMKFNRHRVLHTIVNTNYVHTKHVTDLEGRKG